MLEEQQKLLEKNAQTNLLDVKELHERWFTKKELLDQ